MLEQPRHASWLVAQCAGVRKLSCLCGMNQFQRQGGHLPVMGSLAPHDHVTDLGANQFPASSSAPSLASLFAPFMMRSAILLGRFLAVLTHSCDFAFRAGHFPLASSGPP